MTATHTSPHGPETTPADATLDVRTVGQLRSIPGRTGSLFDDMAPVFLRTSAAQLDRIGERIATGDLAAAAEAAFQLVGACGSFGARRMAASAAALRTTLAGGDLAGLPNQFAQLRSELADVASTLRTLQPVAARSPQACVRG